MTYSFHDVETEEGTDKVDGTENDLSDVGVADADRLEYCGTIVEEVVGTSKLLEHL